MTPPPSGTVTFLFTDIEGSTRLWENHAPSMKAALARHDQVMRQGIEKNGGYVFKTVGDAFCASFVTALDGVRAALECQKALLAERWDVPGGIRVRMALHAGTAEERDGDYFGPTLNRAARLLSTGCGGQTLISLVTSELLRDALPENVSLRDLGSHRLKDLLRTESVFQVDAAGLRSDFPALKSLDNHPNNLPLQPTPFIGREKELETAQRLLRDPACRVLTLTGPGGAGKTRLGLQTAAELTEDFPEGVYFVDLSAIDSSGYVLPAIARTLEIRETGGRPLIDLVKDALKDRRMLLILDNFEQVMTAVPRAVELIGACPSLKLLVTSREALRIRAEKVLPVPPLPAPKLRGVKGFTPARLQQYESVALFIERATSSQPSFAVTNENAPAIAEICARLDGLPLAIELAAARTAMLSPHAILERLGSRLKLLTGGIADLPFRQRTLRATIDWSYRMLSPAEQMLFKEASVFSGGATIATMEKVCACGDEGVDVFETLSSLVDKSLLWRDEKAQGTARYFMLESLREYGLELLSTAGAEKEVRSAHARHFLELAEATELRLRGPNQRRAFDSLEDEHDNFRSALDWLATTSDRDAGLRLCAALGLYWQVRGHLTEGRECCRKLLSEEGGDQRARGEVLRTAGVLAREQGEYAEAAGLLESAIETCRAASADHGVAACICELGMNLYRQGDSAGASVRFRAAQRMSPAVDGILHALAEKGLGLVAEKEGRLDDAWAHFESSRALFAHAGDDRLLAHAVSDLANVSHGRGDSRGALSLSMEALRLRQKVDDAPYLAVSWNNIGFFRAALGEYEEATKCYGALRDMARRTGNRRMLALAHAGLADAALALGNKEVAGTDAAEAYRLSNELGDSMELGVSLRVLGETSLAAGEYLKAKDCFSRSLPLLEKYMELEDQDDIERARKGLAVSSAHLTGA